MKSTADAVVVGGGVMGCSILYNLASRGVKHLVLLEKEVLGSGSTGKSQAILRMHYSNQVTALMAWESLKIYRDFQDMIGGPSGFVNTGYLLLADADDASALEQNVSMQRTLGINTGIVSHEDVEEIAPIINVADAAVLAYEPESGYADPYLVTTTYAKRAKELGAQLYLNAQVTEIEVVGGKVRAVVTNDGTIETSAVVIVAGPWSGSLFSGIGVDVPLTTTRHQVIGFRRPEELIPTHPTVGDITQQFSFRPDPSNLTYIGIGEGSADPHDYDQSVDMEVVRDAFQKLVRRMPDMSQGFFRGGWSGLFTVSPDWHPILDKVEGIDGLYCAVGFSGHGFKLAPIVGITMSELIMDGRATTIDIAPLRMARFRENDPLRSRYRYSVLA